MVASGLERSGITFILFDLNLHYNKGLVRSLELIMSSYYLVMMHRNIQTIGSTISLALQLTASPLVG